jgi:hypothetical protein
MTSSSEIIPKDASKNFRHEKGNSLSISILIGDQKQKYVRVSHGLLHRNVIISEFGLLVLT